MIKYVKYLRVSTKKQGDSGLGLAAQSDIIDHFVQDGTVLATFTEVYTGTDLASCSELQKAVKLCKEEGARLIMYKSDRFRCVSDALAIMDELGEGNLVCCDIPNADRFTFILFFAIAERDALLIGLRTSNALQQIKKKLARGERHVSKSGKVVRSLGHQKGVAGQPRKDIMLSSWKSRLEGDRNRYRQYLTMMDLRSKGVTYAGIAENFNALSDKSPNGGEWSEGQVYYAVKNWGKYYVN